MFERGIFLHHELAGLLHAAGKTSLIGGDGMNEILPQEYYEASRTTTNDPSIRIYPRKPSYVMFADLYIKKNSVMANSYGITQFFPFVDDRFVEIAAATTGLNEGNKSYHKEVCKKVFIPEIYRRASIIGGATEGQAFFDNMGQLRKFYRSVEDTAFCRRHPDILKAAPKSTPYRHSRAILRRIYSSIRYRDGSLTALLLKYEEKKILYYLVVLYLDLFTKLFISGDFDSYFDKEGLDKTLNDLYS